ncbi:DUF1822 family protein [Phormidium sp. FACHB-1136]|uniref:DUF1822 family protein n=1 Tax=Phormidium sp. FACHB-1136 TaxID=2692848 RepID=UPI0018F01F88|nr:DUF1822 family protein [Phormidium sp. FACHB-1136]
MMLPSFSAHPFTALHPMSHATESTEFEFEPSRSTTVTLSTAAIDWAVRVCQQDPDQSRQWPTFLRAMAVQGLQAWLESGADNLSLHGGAEPLPTPDSLYRVNDFRLAIVAQGSLSDDVVTIPKSSLDDAANFAHLYILAEVHDEADHVTILAGLRHDHLLAHRHRGDLISQADGTYIVPVAYFESSPEDILLYLNCLNPDQLTSDRFVTAQAQAKLAPSALFQPMDRLINAGRWLCDQMDTVAHGLSWILLPPLAPAHALMSVSTPAEQLEAVLRQLDPQGVTIPSTARGAYTDLQHLGLPFRLYALTWTLFESSPPEWSLIFFLGPVPGEQLPPDLRLVVRDAAGILVSQTPGPDLSYLYAQVIGTWDEQFTVTIEMPNGSTLDWPPFAFHPEG